MQAKRQHLFTKLGIGICLLSVGIRFIFQKNPMLCENLYGQFFYPFYQSVRSFISIVVPSNLLFYLPFLILLFLLARQIFLLVKGQQKILPFFGYCFALLGFVIAWFYIFWGYNYSRPSLEERLSLTIETPDSTYIFSDLSQTIHSLNELRSKIEIEDTISWYGDLFTERLQKDLDGEVEQFISDYGYKTNFEGMVSELKPKGVLRRFGSSGMFLPWSGEAYFDSGVPNISRPNTYAHELSHVFGITNEGESNFVAYKACVNSKYPLNQYSGALSYYRYAARTAYQTDSIAFRKIEKELDSLVVADMRSKRKCGLLYPDFFPKARDAFYDNYLKTQGVKTGLKDYSKLYLLEYAWRKKHEAVLPAE